MIIKQPNNISKITDQYDLLLVDLWGVIHDGESLYEGTKECLEELKRNGKKVIFISNAPKRAAIAKDGLHNLGISSDLYNHIITSGEITYEHITSGKHDLGKKYYLINEQEVDLLDGSSFEQASSPADADFVVSIGFKQPESTLEELMPTIENCLRNSLPMICANPDLLIVSKAGTPWLCAGVMAEKYCEMGGKVTYFGKPFPQIYEKAFSLFPEIPKNRIAAIGDNILTDIKGGNDFGIDSYLIPGGIHGAELNTIHGELPKAEILEGFCKKHNIFPTGVLATFVS